MKDNSIDHLVEETKEELKKLHKKFIVKGKCCCPLCRSLSKGGDCQDA